MVRIHAGLCALLLACTAGESILAQEPTPVLGEIVLEGNTKTDRGVVERVIDLGPGDPCDFAAIDAVWDRLEDCGYFAFVDIESEEDENGLVTLHISVEEEKTTRYTPYVRYSRRHKFLLGAMLTDHNLGGRGEILELQAIVYRIQRGRATWTKPWLFGQDRLSLTADALWERGGFVWRPFDYARWHTKLSARSEIAGPVYAEAGGGFESFDQKDDYRWDEGAGLTTFAAGRRDTWLLRGLVGVDTRDNPYYPGRGVFATYALDYRAGLDIDGQVTHEVDLRAFVPLPGAPVLALRGFGTRSDPVRATEYVLRWGGPETVRGAPYAGREGDTAYLATVELRWPLAMMPVATTGENVGVGVHLFGDVGDAFYADAPGADPRALASFGGGAHLNLLSWQLRFEAAKERDHDWTFEFMDVFNF
ncbi:MAG TPA: BamA/TamA family outer membrane protein [Candidatus Krumholzibacteria bacterium]|nr:BamA/TamA family outer membrane protein [Candidatus Krumholzibacteria bacterium]HPD70637.1 BamA/TamA family outer membrane protein [Candidatus Krumholzibacteria bacterium]HRY39663.1 BamA/TamA family outer membrane protein [Candidatus Krumholzibacteria bacterium]